MEVNPNSQQPTGSSALPNNLGNIQRPGEYLRQIRISQARELKVVAADLNMPLKTLEALEQDDYKVLPQATFIKGYYRSYAKYLKVDATALIHRFDEIYENDTGLVSNHALNNSPIKFMGKLPGSHSDRNRKWLKRIIVILVILVVIFLVFTLLQKWMSKDAGEQQNPQNNAVEVLTLDNGNEPNQQAVSGDVMVVSFSHPTSVHIVDSTGKVLATGRQASTLNLNGESPFEIRLDDATAVTLSLNNESISLSPYTVNGKAQFRLSP